MKIQNWLKSGLLALAMIFSFAQCEDGLMTPTNPTDPSSNVDKGKANFEITDAPIDNANIEGVFVTITEIKVDGQTFDGFDGKQTINLMNYQQGDVKFLGLGELEAGTYSEITLVLDYAVDANGASPGCYVLTLDNKKHKLAKSGETTGEIVLNKAFEIKKDAETTLVADFDIRKAITDEDDVNSDSDFQFVTMSELTSSIRVVDKETTGEIEGSYQANNLLVDADKVVAFAYKKGTYNANIEAEGQGESEITFKNAVTSTAVDANGNFKLAFLEEGDYEVHFIGFEDDDNDGEFEMMGEIQVNLTSSLGLNLSNISVQSNTSVSFDVIVTGIIPF